MLFGKPVDLNTDCELAGAEREGDKEIRDVGGEKRKIHWKS